MTEICKLLFDFCFYYALSGYFLQLFALSHPSGFGIPLLILVTAVFVLLEKRKTPVKNRHRDTATSDARAATGISDARAATGISDGKLVAAIRNAKPVEPAQIICCALPGLFFLFSPTIYQTAQFLPAWVYLGYTVFSKRIFTTREDFERHFKFSAKLFGLMLIGIVLPGRIVGAVNVAVPYLVVYLLTGVLLMRIQREDGRLARSRNTVVMVALLLVSIILAVMDVPSIVLSAGGFVYRNVISWIIYGLAIVISAVFYAFAWVITRIFGGRAPGSETPVNPDPAADGSLLTNAEAVLRAVPVWIEVAVVILLVFAVLFIIYKIMRRLLGNRLKDGRAKAYTEEREKLTKQPRNARDGLLRPKEPRLAVRWFYRKCIKEGQLRGAKTDIADTSHSIMNKHKPYFSEEAAENFRDIYIVARYRYADEITRENADAISQIWRRVKREQAGST